MKISLNQLRKIIKEEIENASHPVDRLVRELVQQVSSSNKNIDSDKLENAIHRAIDVCIEECDADDSDWDKGNWDPIQKWPS